MMILNWSEAELSKESGYYPGTSRSSINSQSSICWLPICHFLVIVCCRVGFVEVNPRASLTMESVESRHAAVRAGGRWSPANCSAWQKLAIMISYRDRYEQLVLLLNRLHTLLQRQMAYYQIFVIEQVLLSFVSYNIFTLSSAIGVFTIETLGPCPLSPWTTKNLAYGQKCIHTHIFVQLFFEILCANVHENH